MSVVFVWSVQSNQAQTQAIWTRETETRGKQETQELQTNVRGRDIDVTLQAHQIRYWSVITIAMRL